MNKKTAALRRRNGNSNPNFMSMNKTQSLAIYPVKNEPQKSEAQSQLKSQYSQGGRSRKIPQGMKQFLKSKKRQIKTHNQETHSMNQNSRDALKLDHTIQIIQLEEVQDRKVQISKRPQLKNQTKPKETNEVRISQTKKVQDTTNNKCQICQGETELRDFVVAFKCEHRYCKNCLINYVGYKISMFQEVRCPNELCQNTLDVKCSFYDGLKKRERRNYKKIHNFESTKTSNDLKLCPKQDCDGIIKLKENSKSQACKECHTQFCSHCFLPVHEDACKQYEVNYLQNNFHYRQCQKCKLVVERIQGCNHITCKCKYQFCYICGAKWEHDHLCNQQVIQNDDNNGCDFGQNCFQHFCFLIKIPFKIVVIFLYTALFVIASFSAAPYNLMFFIYWLGLILIGGPCQFIGENQRTWWEIFLMILFFPVLMIVCIPKGVRIFAIKFSDQCEFISDGYRWIVRL